MKRIILTKEIALQRCKEKWGERYEYLDFYRKGNHCFIKAKCPKHGIFEIYYYNLLKGNGCLKCKIENQKTVVYGYGINDYNHNVKINGKHILSYHLWVAMLQRCMDKKQIKEAIIYEGCSVGEEWKYYTNFKKWHDEHYIEGYALDKDIINRGNKVYCPEYCSYVPKYINSLLLFRGRDRGIYPLGVYKDSKYNKFIASVNKKGKSVYLGTFDTPEEAFLVYKKAKEDYIEEVAEFYFGKGLIEERVYNALIKYEVNIND